MPDTSSTNTKPKHLTNRIAWLKETSIRLDQGYKDGKILVNTETIGGLCSMLAGMMEDLEKRVSRLEQATHLRS